MTPRPAPMRQSLAAYVDHVVRKEHFLRDHPDARVWLDGQAPPYRRWRGSVPDYPEATSHDLGYLLDQLDDLVAAADAHARWPNWAFTRKLGSWQARRADGSELVMGRTLAQVETQVAAREKPNRASGNT